jgi:hypothetical protein
MFIFANPFNGPILDIDLLNVPETFAHEFLYFGAGAHHGKQLVVGKEVKARVLGADGCHELKDVELEF